LYYNTPLFVNIFPKTIDKLTLSRYNYPINFIESPGAVATSPGHDTKESDSCVCFDIT